MDENIIKSIKKFVLDNVDIREFDRIHDVMVDVLNIDEPSEEQIKTIVMIMPSDIFCEGLKWDFSDTVVGDEVFEWFEKDKTKILKELEV